MAQEKHLDEAFAAARALSDADQAILAAEIIDRVAQLERGALSAELEDAVRSRMAAPIYADPEQVAAFFARHGAR